MGHGQHGRMDMDMDMDMGMDMGHGHETWQHGNMGHGAWGMEYNIDHTQSEGSSNAVMSVHLTGASSSRDGRR